jgi:hypothetical protein
LFLPPPWDSWWAAASCPQFFSPTILEQQNAAGDKNGASAQTIDERHQATEEAIAYYNKWLMFFTAVLAVATIVLGIATVALYLSAEKQTDIATQTNQASQKAADAAALNAQALIDAERARLYPVIRKTNLHEVLGGAKFFDNSPTMDEREVARPEVDLSFKNLGRTTAILHEISAQLVQGTPDQRDFEYAMAIVVDPVIDGGKETPTKFQSNREIVSPSAIRRLRWMSGRCISTGMSLMPRHSTASMNIIGDTRTTAWSGF